jgi:hypothetical protein
MTFRPLDQRLNQALDRYQSENFLPSRNAAINQILSRALLGGSQPQPTQAQPTQPTTPPISTPPIAIPQPPIGWG